MHCRSICMLTVMIGFAARCLCASDKPVVVFDFETEADVAAWKNVDVNALRAAEEAAHLAALRRAATIPATLPASKPLLASEPAVRIAWSAEHATSGQHSLKLTFTGGRFPAVGAAPAIVDWS